MKITFEDKKKVRRVEQLSMGQTFVYKREVYMKMGEYSNLKYNALALAYGTLKTLPNNAVVEVVDCELVIRSISDENTERDELGDAE